MYFRCGLTPLPPTKYSIGAGAVSVVLRYTGSTILMCISRQKQVKGKKRQRDTAPLAFAAMVVLCWAVVL